MQIYAIIKPNSKHHEGVLESENGILIIRTKAPATENKANIAAIGLIAKHYGVSKTNVQLVRGHTSKYKVFEVNKNDILHA